MTYRITVDRTLCSGFAACVQAAPAVFRLAGGAAEAVVAESGDPRAVDAARSCPMGAITLTALEEAA